MALSFDASTNGAKYREAIQRPLNQMLKIMIIYPHNQVHF